MKGLPTGYNKDLQEDKEAVFGAEDTLAGCLAVVRSVVNGLTLNRERAAAAASGLLLATDVADYLVGRGRAVPARARNRRRAGAQTRRRTIGISSRCHSANGAAASDTFEADIVDAHDAATCRWPPSERRNRPRRRRCAARLVGAADSGCDGQASYAKIPSPFALLSPPAVTLGSVDAAAPASAW